MLTEDGKLSRDYLYDIEKKDNIITQDYSKPIYITENKEVCEEVLDEEAVYEEVCEDVIMENEEIINECRTELVKEATYKQVCETIQVETLTGYETMLQNATDVGAMSFNNRLLISEI